MLWSGFHGRGHRSGIKCTGAILIGRKIALILAFASKTLREICEDEEQAERRFGKKVAESLKHRLADLEAAPAPTDLIAGRLQLQNPTGNYSVRLVDGFCLEFAANHVKNPLDKNKNVDWKKVSRIQIVRIGKCHD
jgi:plasmid maintenance system killer protein